jgi:hypothetical protein
LTGAMRRAGFLATLAAGVGLLGASLHGMTSMDATLKVAAATPARPGFVVDHRRDGGPCREGRPDRGHDHPRV